MYSLISHCFLQLEEAEDRQKILLNILRKEMSHSQRMVGVSNVLDCNAGGLRGRWGALRLGCNM